MGETNIKKIKEYSFLNNSFDLILLMVFYVMNDIIKLRQ